MEIFTHFPRLIWFTSFYKFYVFSFTKTCSKWDVICKILTVSSCLTKVLRFLRHLELVRWFFLLKLVAKLYVKLELFFWRISLFRLSVARVTTFFTFLDKSPNLICWFSRNSWRNCSNRHFGEWLENDVSKTKSISTFSWQIRINLQQWCYFGFRRIFQK